MSETTTTVRTQQAETPTTTPATQAEFAADATQRVAWWAALTPEQAFRIASDWEESGVPAAEYVASLSCYDGYDAFVADADLDDGGEGDQQQPAAEQSPAEPADTAAATAAQVQAAQQDAEAAEQAARAEAAETLKAVVKHYRAGEKAYRQGLLEAGRLADLYCHQRMALGDKRAAAIQAVEGKLAEWSSGKVDAGDLIRSYQAYALLALPLLDRVDVAAVQAAEGGDAKAAAATKKAAQTTRAAVDAVPYGFYRDAYCQLVQRQDADKPTEHWTLLPGLESDCLDLFERCTADRLSKDAVTQHVKALQARYATAQREAADKAAAETKAAKEAADQREREAEAERWRLAEEKRQLEAAAKAEQREEERQRLQAEAAEKERLEREAAAKRNREREEKERLAEEERKRQREAQAAKDREQKATATAEQAAKTPEERKADRQAAKEGKTATAEAAEPKQSHRETAQAQNLLKTAAKATEATPKDWAQMVVDFITQHPKPDDVLEHVLVLVGQAEVLSRKGIRACNAALMELRKADKPAEAIGHSNGKANGHANGKANGELAGAAAN